MGYEAGPLPAEPGSSLAEHAYRVLREALIACEFPPDARLKIEALSERYGLSSSPLREALARLVQDGLVVALENRGFRVAPLSLAELDDLVRVRVLVECEALRVAVGQGDDRWETRVVAAFHGLSLIEQRLGKGPVALNEDWARRHREFHFALLAGCGSARLMRLAESGFLQAERFRRFSARFRQREKDKHAEHKRLMDASLARDADAAVRLQRKHIVDTAKNVADALAVMQEAGRARAPA